MEIEPARILRTLIITLILATGTACSPAWQGNLFKLDIPGNCPPADDALAASNTDPINSTESQLACALQAVRDMQPPERSPRAHESLQAARLCAALAEAGSSGPDAAERRKSLAWEGVAWAEHAMATGLAIDPATSYYYSVNLGVAVRDSIMTAMKYLGRLQRHLERAVREEPGLDQGGPLRTMGYLLIKAPAWPAGIGDTDKGIEMLRRAAREFPDYPPNAIYLARGIWEGEEDEEAALKEAARAAGLLRSRNWGIRHAAWTADLGRLLEEIAGPEEAAAILSEPAGESLTGEQKPIG